MELWNFNHGPWVRCINCVKIVRARSGRMDGGDGVIANAERNNPRRAKKTQPSALEVVVVLAAVAGWGHPSSMSKKPVHQKIKQYMEQFLAIQVKLEKTKLTWMRKGDL